MYKKNGKTYTPLVCPICKERVKLDGLSNIEMEENRIPKLIHKSCKKSFPLEETIYSFYGQDFWMVEIV